VKATHRDDDGFCVGATGDLKARSQAATASNASDFARDHPPFRLSLPSENGVRRERQGDKALVESSNLAFPHARTSIQGRALPLRGA
jgi:hypothetical protein